MTIPAHYVIIRMSVVYQRVYARKRPPDAGDADSPAAPYNLTAKARSAMTGHGGSTPSAGISFERQTERLDNLHLICYNEYEILKEVRG